MKEEEIKNDNNSQQLEEIKESNKNDDSNDDKIESKQLS